MLQRHGLIGEARDLMHEISETELPVVKDVGAVSVAKRIQGGVERCAEGSPDGLNGGHIREAVERWIGLR